MIRFAYPEEKEELKKIWLEAFVMDDGGYTDYFFQERYDAGKHYVLHNDETIVSIASSFASAYMINDRMLRASMIVGVATKEAYQGQGYMTKLLNEIISQLEHQELLTMIQAYEPNIYKKFGFEVVYKRQKYYFSRETYDVGSSFNVLDYYEVHDLVKVYARFVKHFSGYKVREVSDFELYFKEIEALGGHLMTVYRANEIKGYLVYRIVDDVVEIDECIYLDLKTLNQIISYALKIAPRLELTVSEYEDLGRRFKYNAKELEDYTMVRINDYKLWNKLFECEVDNAYDALTLVNKPLYMREDT